MQLNQLYLEKAVDYLYDQINIVGEPEISLETEDTLYEEYNVSYDTINTTYYIIEKTDHESFETIFKAKILALLTVNFYLDRGIGLNLETKTIDINGNSNDDDSYSKVLNIQFNSYEVLEGNISDKDKEDMIKILIDEFSDNPINYEYEDNDWTISGTGENIKNFLIPSNTLKI